MISISTIQPRSTSGTSGHTTTRTAARRGNNSLRRIPERAKQLADVGAFQGKSWSLAEACEHLALAFESTVRGSGDEEPPRQVRSRGKWLEVQLPVRRR